MRLDNTWILSFFKNTEGGDDAFLGSIFINPALEESVVMPGETTGCTEKPSAPEGSFFSDSEDLFPLFI